MHRRSFTLALTTGLVAQAKPSPPGSALETIDLSLKGDKKLARKARLLLPRHLPKNRRVNLLVLLHGLGETRSEALGLRAWSDFYGLVRSYERLLNPPIARTLPKQRYLRVELQRKLNASLKRDPFSGLAMVCPVTPNPYRLQPSGKTLDRYAAWLEEELLPTVKKKIPNINWVGLDGCSLGGYVGLEVFLRKPGLFRTVGALQGAYGQSAARRYAEEIAKRIAQVGPRPVRLGTSTLDPYRRANVKLSKRLSELSVPNTLSVLPGPHNQPWLREIGTLAMLRWHERQLSALRPKKTSP